MPSPLRRLNGALWNAPIVLLTLTALFWGANAVAGRMAIGHVGPLSLTFLRWLMVISVLWQLYGREVREQWPVIRTRLPSILSMGFFGFTAFNVLFYVGAHYTTAINLGILQGSIPVFVMVFAYFAHGTRSTPLQIVGVLITLAGVALVATQGQPQKILHLYLNRGDLAMLTACLLYSVYAVALPGRPKMSGPAFFTLLALVAAATSLPLGLGELMSGHAAPPTAKGWAIILFVAIFPSCIAQLFFMRGVDLIGPGRAGVFVNLVPVFASALGVLLINEPFAWYHGVALLLVGGGIALAQRAGAAAKAR